MGFNRSETEKSLQDLRRGLFVDVVSREPDGLKSLPRLIKELEQDNTPIPLNMLLMDGQLGAVISGIERRPEVEQVAQTIIDLASLRSFHLGKDVGMSYRAIAFQVGTNLGNLDDSADYTIGVIKALGERGQDYFPVTSRRRGI
jgi:hypothetical protein